MIYYFVILYSNICFHYIIIYIHIHHLYHLYHLLYHLDGSLIYDRLSPEEARSRWGARPRPSGAGIHDSNEFTCFETLRNSSKLHDFQ